VTVAKQRITIINDDAVYMELMKDLLEDEGYRATIWNRKENAYYVIKRERPNLIIIDIRLQSPDEGWKILEQVRLDPMTTNIPAIVCSADTQFLRWKRRQLRLMNCEALEKPFRLEDLLREVEKLIGESG
jgi:CheY-like chemotaxis protein